MATINIETILERVQDLKHESAEKDEVIRVQQEQITELEHKAESLEAHCRALEEKIDELTEAAGKADELIEKLHQLLG